METFLDWVPVVFCVVSGWMAVDIALIFLWVRFRNGCDNEELM